MNGSRPSFYNACCLCGLSKGSALAIKDVISPATKMPESKKSTLSFSCRYARRGRNEAELGGRIDNTSSLSPIRNHLEIKLHSGLHSRLPYTQASVSKIKHAQRGIRLAFHTPP
jgi:hypothetical protein